jgi:hypothetical protein
VSCADSANSTIKKAKRRLKKRIENEKPGHELGQV